MMWASARRVRLGELCQFSSGGTPRKNVKKFYTGTIPWITGADVVNDKIQEPRHYITQEAKDNSATNVVPAGNILLVTRTGVGKVAITDRAICISQDFTGIIPNKERIDLYYLYHYLRSSRNYFTRNQRGATIKGVTRDVVQNLEIPIPYPDDAERSLAEQLRIVAELETLQSEVHEMYKLASDIRDDVGLLMDAVIQDTFDKPNNSWRISLLTDIAIVQTGTSKGRRFGDRKTIKVPYLRVANVQAGYLDLNEVKTITIAENEVERYRLQTGDLLLTEGGDYDKLGRGVVWNSEIDPCIHQNHIFAVRFDPDLILPRFAEYEMQSWHARSYFLSVAKKTTNLATINKTKLGNFPLRYPSLAEQRVIVARLDATKAEIVEMQETQLEDAGLVEQLERSILAQAFRGEL